MGTFYGKLAASVVYTFYLMLIKNIYLGVRDALVGTRAKRTKYLFNNLKLASKWRVRESPCVIMRTYGWDY